MHLINRHNCYFDYGENCFLFYFDELYNYNAKKEQQYLNILKILERQWFIFIL